MMVGITIGVSVAVSIDLANASAATRLRSEHRSDRWPCHSQISAEPNVLMNPCMPACPSEYCRFCFPDIDGICFFTTAKQSFHAIVGMILLLTRPLEAIFVMKKVVPSDWTAFFTQPGAILLSSELAEPMDTSLLIHDAF